MLPPSPLLVLVLFALNWATRDVYASLGSRTETLVRRGDVHRMIKRQIRNADYAMTAPPKPLDPSTSTANITIASSDTAKALKRFVPLDDSSANLFDPSELPHRLPHRSETVWTRNTDSHTRLLQERAASMSAAKGSQNTKFDSNLFTPTPKDDLSKKYRQGINEDILAAWMKKRAVHVHHPGPHHSPRHIVKHEYHTRVSVVKHTLPARRNIPGTSPESMQDVAAAKRSATHSRRRE